MMSNYARPLAIFLRLVVLIGFLFQSALPAAASVRQALPPLNLPPGFSDQTVISGLLAPRAFAFTPDGRILILERGSASSQDINFASVRVFKNGTLLPARALTLNVCGDGERGLLGIAIDPNFAANGFLYLYYTRQAASGPSCAYNTYANGQPGPRNRVSRFTMSGDVINPASEQVLLDNISTDSGIHNAGDLHFGMDGYLYISTGDANMLPVPSQSLTNLNGKILRIFPLTGPGGGYSTAGNPFDASADAWNCGTLPPGSFTGPCKEIFAYGFRNPFRFSIRPGTSTPFVGDVGGGAWEEIDQVISGGNYGYPHREGPCAAGVICSLPQPPSGYQEPIYAYPHTVLYANVDSAVIAGPFYTGSSYPAGYQDSLFFADFVQGWIKRLQYHPSMGHWMAFDFATGGSGIIGLRTGPQGDLHYLRIVSESDPTSEIRRIRYNSGSGNQPPVAQISVTPSGGPADTLFSFSAAGSLDPDGNTPLAYRWDFGDGTVLDYSSQAAPTHTYAAPGPKTVILTVRDSGTPPAESDPVTLTVYPGDHPPTATINLQNLSRPGSSLYHAGDAWGFAVSDPADDHPLPADAFTWDVVFHHRDHTHPFLAGIAGSSGQFEIPTSGELDPVVWYQVVLHVRDSVGQVATIARDIHPEVVEVALETRPAGGTLLLENKPVQTPITVQRVVGIQSSLEAPAPQDFNGLSLGFNRWSHDGPAFQVFNVPPGGGTFTAWYGSWLFMPQVKNQ